MTPETSSSAEITPDPERLACWERVRARVDQVKDKLGKEIDERIKDTVVAFLVNEFPTRQSCEGHLEERSGKMKKIAPYVDVEVELPEERFVGGREIRKNIAEQFSIPEEDIEKGGSPGRAYWDYISANRVPETAEYQEARTKNKGLKKRAEELIAQFYAQRSEKGDPSLRIIDRGASGQFRVEGSQGFAREVAEKDMERYRETLLKEQEDMGALTEFLKKRFFKGESE